MPDPLKPDITLLCKLGSIIVHADELLSDDGHAFDKIALQQLFKDKQVQQWMKDMGPYLPVKRK